MNFDYGLCWLLKASTEIGADNSFFCVTAEINKFILMYCTLPNRWPKYANNSRGSNFVETWPRYWKSRPSRQLDLLSVAALWYLLLMDDLFWTFWQHVNHGLKEAATNILPSACRYCSALHSKVCLEGINNEAMENLLQVESKARMISVCICQD